MAVARILMVTMMMTQMVCAGQVRKEGAAAAGGLVLSKDTVYADGFPGPDFRDTCLLRNMTGAQVSVDRKNISDQTLCTTQAAIYFRAEFPDGHASGTYYFSCYDPYIGGPAMAIPAGGAVRLLRFDFPYGGTLTKSRKTSALRDTIRARVVFITGSYSDTLVIVGPGPIPSAARLIYSLPPSEASPLAVDVASHAYDIRGKRLRGGVVENGSRRMVAGQALCVKGNGRGPYLMLK